MSAEKTKEQFEQELTEAIAQLPPEVRERVAEHLGNVLFDVDLAMEQVQEHSATAFNALSVLYNIAKNLNKRFKP